MEYLWAVQDTNGREVVAFKAEVDKVSAVTADVDGRTLTIRHGKDVVATTDELPPGELTLYRWKAHKKLDPPVAKSIKRVDASG